MTRGRRGWVLPLLVALAACSDATAPVVPTATTIVPSTATVTFTALGQQQTLAATVLDQTGAALSGAVLSWTSTAGTVATVTAAGVVTAAGNGAATIMVASGTASASIGVTVGQVPASLGVTPGQATFTALGDTLRVGAAVTDAGGSQIVGAVVVWSVLDTTVATVTAAGLLEAVGPGTTRLLATSGASFASAAVTVSQAPNALVLSADTVNLSAIGDTLTLGAAVTDAGGSAVAQPSVTWLSRDTLVAKVSAAGRITAVANGAATLTAAAGAQVDSAVVVVRQVAASLLVWPDSVVIKDPGDVSKLTLAAWDARGVPIVGPSVMWSSADMAIADVDGTGLVTGNATGTVAISAQVDAVVVQGSARVEPEVTLVPAGPTALAGEVTSQLSLTVQVRDLLGGGYTGTTVWWSADPGSGTIVSGTSTESNATGHTGAVWQLGTTAGPQRATATIESRGNVVEIEFDATAAAGPAISAALVADSILLSGQLETALLAPSFADQYGNPALLAAVTWAARDPSVVDVAADGLLTAKNAGATYVVGTLGAPQDSLLVTVEMPGAITITFDDGFMETYTNAYPALQAAGLRANIGVNPQQVGFPAYLTTTQLDELSAAGWSVVSHSLQHDTLWTLSDEGLDVDLRASQQWIDAHGYEGSNVFIVPFHLWDVRERNAIATYYDAARGTSAGASMPDSLASWLPSDPYALTGIEADLLPYTDPAGLVVLHDLLQRTADEGAFVDVFFHHLPDGNVADFEALVAVIDEFHDRVLPYHELYPKVPRTIF